MNSTSRRKFLKTSIRALGAVTLGASIEQIIGCAALAPMGPEPNVTYPKLKGKKIQPPDSGCMVGFYGMDPLFYKEKIGAAPAIQVVNYDLAYSLNWPRRNVEEIVEGGSIPFVYLTPKAEIQYWGIHTLTGRKEFEQSVTTLADNIVASATPIFFCTMPEMNGNFNAWKGAENMGNVWKYMWQIFEDRGANEYVTWVWEVICPCSPSDSMVNNPESFYYGDQYIDWIGISGYARSGFPCTDTSFQNIVAPTYSQMRRNHPDKPIMMAEFGKTMDSWQPTWLQKAYKTIKDWQGMKAAVLWNNTNYTIRDNHQLTPESYAVLSEIRKDPYFIFGK